MRTAKIIQIMNNKILIFFLPLMALQQLSYAQGINVTDVPISTVVGNNQVENAVFISPLSKFVIVNSNNSIPGIGLLGFSVSSFISTDEGQSWTGDIFGPDTNGHGDPSVVIDRTGRIIVSYLAFPTPRHLNVSFSDDNGGTWTAVGVPGTFVGADKQHLWIDNNLNSPYEGRIYMAFNSNVFDILFTYSTNGGASGSWLTGTLENIASTISPSPGFENLGVNLQTGPQGQVYACWSTIDVPNSNQADNTRIYFNRSIDGGDNWLTNAINIGAVQGLFTMIVSSKSAFKMFPSMAVNQQTGTIYMVYDVDNDPAGNVVDGDIQFIKSVDQGDTWTTAVRVNQDATTNDQWDPWIACDEISNALVVVYYDSRNFPANNRAETFVSISYDDGNTWEDHQISDVGEDWSGTAFLQPGMDYIQVDVYHGLAIPVWSDDRSSAGTDFIAYTNPFEVPCPQDLDLIFGDYDIFDQGTFTFDAAYKTTGTINVAGGGNTYKVHQGAEVLMEAGTEIIFTGDVVITGNLIATINPVCASFSERLTDSNPANSNGTKNEPIAKIEYQKRDLEIDKYYFTRFYPNPADNFTNIEYIITNNSDVNITIYNASGKIIGNIVNNTNQPKGKYQIRFDAGNLIPGLYFCTITTKDYTASHKFSVVK